MRARAVSVAACFVGLLACSGEGEPEPQLLVVLDTNAALMGQIAAGAALSPDAAVDTVRVDVLQDDGIVIDHLDIVAPEPADWPLSFGIVAGPAGSSRVVIRVRAFRGIHAGVGDLAGATTLEPPPEVTIDRLVDLPLPDAGVKVVRVLLDAECFARPSVFLEPPRTCVSGAEPSAEPARGVEVLDGVPRSTAAGTWASAGYRACRDAPPACTATGGRLCIPGGFFLMGDETIVGLSPTWYASSTPLRPVRLSPFWMDQTEFTVGRFRALLARGGFDATMPEPYTPTDADRQYCSFLGASDPANDAFALNCINRQAAARACELEGGRLPTEAEWEWVARGRGERRRFPWGETDPTCCGASVSRVSFPGTRVICTGVGPEPVGSHTDAAACGIADVSRDCVFDLAGGMAEVTLDSFQDFDGACWSRVGILEDPQCVDATTTSRVQRGGEWSAGTGVATAALRNRWPGTFWGQQAGFRCAYPEVAP